MQKKCFKKIAIICLIIMQIFTISGCGKENKEESNKINIIHGTNVLISGQIGEGVYIKNYQIMDCCDEFNTITPIVNGLENATAYEMYDLDLFDSKGEICQPAGNINVRLTISNELISSNGNKYIVYSLEGEELVEVSAQYDGGIITFGTDTLGVYTIVKFGESSDGVQFTINGCDGTCKTCD